MAYFQPEALTQKERYKLVTGAVVPRPIAWVSSMDRAGLLNLAPYSFFTVASTNPLTLLFCPQTPEPGGAKDTLRNIEAVGEFVVNIVGEATAVAMNLTATRLPPGESEFAYAGVRPEPSTAVSVPRVAEALIAFECTLSQLVRVNDTAVGGGTIILGTVQAIYTHNDVYDTTTGYISHEKLQPIGRLAGNQYAHLYELFTLIRQ
jgi:flavin reductase (DIM6/NTAB) family NADH-FMN oxidoreductase RutF